MPRRRLYLRDRAEARPPFLAAVRLRLRDELPPPLRLRERLDPFVSPFWRRVLLTVAAAMRLAVPALRPRLFADLLMCSYCLSRLLLQDFGIPSPRADSDAITSSANYAPDFSGERGRSKRSSGSSSTAAANE